MRQSLYRAKMETISFIHFSFELSEAFGIFSQFSKKILSLLSNILNLVCTGLYDRPVLPQEFATTIKLAEKL